METRERIACKLLSAFTGVKREPPCGNGMLREADYAIALLEDLKKRMTEAVLTPGCTYLPTRIHIAELCSVVPLIAPAPEPVWCEHHSINSDGTERFALNKVNGWATNTAMPFRYCPICGAKKPEQAK